ncbi:MAG: protein kinase [Planctomycetota bacterium]|nr:protein kinase [Planctomycetota bacterium]
MAGSIPTVDSLSPAQRLRVEESTGRFRKALLAGQSARIRDCLAGTSGIEQQVLLRELLQIEIENRRKRGQMPSHDDYISQFPDSNEIVATVFASFDPARSSPAAIETVVPGQGVTVDDVILTPPNSLLSISETIIESEGSSVANSGSRVETVIAPADEGADSRQDDSTSAEVALRFTADSAQMQTDVETIVPQDYASAGTMDENRIMPTVISSGGAGLSPGAASKRSSSGPVIGSGQTFGDYELISPLGQGGMGVVYKARQKAANRLVALKIIRPDRLGHMTEVTRRRMIERFQAEAHAAARLQHDNLVTVYDVGEIDGCHYFSMQYVEGGSLSDRIRDRSLDNREAATFIEPICRAVYAAHQQGVLHRDIKPANILIEKGTLRPRIADFGLAKIQDEDLELTQSGEAMGTPSYMPPEQFSDAASATARADIYSLGATLYHLLSSRPPFQAASTMATMRQVLDVDPVSLRELNPEVDRDLETLCMKCLEKEPARRFQTAEELADELQRYLNGEPILSRPLGRSERLWRWCRRNPIVSSLSGIAGTSVLVALVSFAVAYIETDSARRKVEASLAATDKAQKLSEASFQDALEAVNDFFTHVSEDRLLNEPGTEELRHELLQLAHDYYQRFLNRRSDDPTVREEVALSHFRVGLIVEELDSPQAAVVSFEKSRDMQLTMLAATPDSKPVKRALSRTLNALARAATNLGDLDHAEELFDETRRLRVDLVSSTEDSEERFEFDRLLANVDMNLGLLARRRGNFDKAKMLYEQGQKHRKETLLVRKKDPQLRRDLAKGWYNLANLAVDVNNPEAVRNNVELAIRELEKLLTEQPDDLRDRYLLALCYRLLADLNAALIPVNESKLPEAIDAYTRARFAMQDLAGRSPAVHRYRVELGQLLMNIGQLEAQRQQYASARVLLEKAADVFRELVKEAPDNEDFRNLQTQVQSVLEQLSKLQTESRLP